MADIDGLPFEDLIDQNPADFYDIQANKLRRAYVSKSKTIQDGTDGIPGDLNYVGQKSDNKLENRKYSFNRHLSDEKRYKERRRSSSRSPNREDTHHYRSERDKYRRESDRRRYSESRRSDTDSDSRCEDDYDRRVWKF